MTTAIATTIATPTRDRVRPFDVLWETDTGASIDRPTRGGTLPDELAARYGGRLEIPLHPERPTMIVNFVSTLDGAVALDRVGASGGREISGASEPDRFVMGLLRATVDAVLIGAGTVRSSRTHAWTAEQVHPPSADAYARWRRELGLASDAPTTVIVSLSGDLEARQLGLEDRERPVIVLTTSAGARRLRSTLGSRGHVHIIDVQDEGPIRAATITSVLQERGFELVLCEGGPRLLGELLSADAVDELFLTVAPQIVGRGDGVERLALVEDRAFTPSTAPWTRLRSVRRADDHLFLRYGVENQQGGMS